MFDSVYKRRRVIVTGHTGFKGSWLCQWLLHLGAEVAGYSLHRPSDPCNFDVLGLEQRLSHHTGDIRDLAGVRKTFSRFRPEIVFHLAAQAITRRSYDEPKATFDTNLGGTVNLLEAALESESVKAAVFITSDKCYENVEWDQGYRETDRLGGKDPYSASKACAEIAISSYARSFFLPRGRHVASTRAGNVVGGGDWAPDRIVPDCVRAWSAAKSPLIRNPSATRPWQHVLEPLSGYLWLGARLHQADAGLDGEAFNFGPIADQPVSVLIEEMQQSWPGRSWTVDPSGAKDKHEAGLLKLNCEKALHRLGWKPTLSFPEIVRMTVAWYREYYAGGRDMARFTEDQVRGYEQLARDRGAPWAQP